MTILLLLFWLKYNYSKLVVWKFTGLLLYGNIKAAKSVEFLILILSHLQIEHHCWKESVTFTIKSPRA